MGRTKKSIKRMLGWLLCMAMLLAALPSNLFTAEAAEETWEGIVTIDNAGLYSKPQALDKNIVGRVKVNTLLKVPTKKLFDDDTWTTFDQFYQVHYTVNGKTETYYVLYSQMFIFSGAVEQPKGTTTAYVSGLKEGETVRCYISKKRTTGATSGTGTYFSNGAMVFVKESTPDGWSEIYSSNTSTSRMYIKTEYLSLDKNGNTPVATPKPSPTPKPIGAPAAKPIGKTTMNDVPLYSSVKMEEKAATVSANTLLNLVSTKKIEAQNPAYKGKYLYETEYTVDGKKVTCYVECLRVNLYENGVEHPAGTVMEVIQGLQANQMIDVLYDGKVIGWLRNDAEVDVYQKTYSHGYIDFNGVTAEISTAKHLVTPTPTPTPTPTLSPVKTVKEGDYEVVAKGTLIYASRSVRNNPSERSGSKDSTALVNTVFDIVSLEQIPSIDANSEEMYYKVAYKGTKGLGYYYVETDKLDIRTFGKVPSTYLVDGLTNIEAGYVTAIRSSTSLFNSKNIITQISGNAKVKIDPTFEDAYWTKIYFNNQDAYIPSQFVTKAPIPAKDVLAADQAGLAKAYPDMEIIAQAYLVGTDSVVQAAKTIEISPIEEYDVVQNEWIDEKYVPKSGYLAYEAATLSVVDYDDERVVFWSNGYQLEAGDAARIDAKASVVKELHTAGFYQVPRDMVLLDLGNAEVAEAGETVETVAEAMATANIGLNTSPEMSWDGYEYVVPQNSRVKLVSTEKIPAIDGSDTMYYKVALKLDSPTGYLNKENVSYYYVDSNFVNVYKDTYKHPNMATAGVVTGLEEDEVLEIYAKNSESSEIIGYLTNGANVDYVQSSTKWKKIVFNSQYAYVKAANVGNPELDRTGIPNKMGVTDVYFSQGNLNLENVYPNIQVIGKAEIKSAEIGVGIVSPYTVIQGQRVAAKYFPDWNIKNLKELYKRHVSATVVQNFTFMSTENAYIEGGTVNVVAYNDDVVIYWSRGYRSFTVDSLLVDCYQYRIQLTHPAGFYCIPRSAVNLTLYK